MCNIDVNVQMKVFERRPNTSRTRAEVIKRLHASGVVTRDGKMTQWYQTLIERSHESAL